MNEGVAEIMAMSRETLLERWQSVFGKEPPRHTHASFLRLALAWQFQAKGKLAGPAKLPNLASGKSPAMPFGPGTRLVREWQGTTYHVLVTASGFEMEGRIYKSLSAIARSITGTAWSGPAFFGLNR